MSLARFCETPNELDRCLTLTFYNYLGQAYLSFRAESRNL